MVYSVCMAGCMAGRMAAEGRYMSGVLRETLQRLTRTCPLVINHAMRYGFRRTCAAVLQVCVSTKQPGPFARDNGRRYAGRAAGLF